MSKLTLPTLVEGDKIVVHSIEPDWHPMPPPGVTLRFSVVSQEKFLWWTYSSRNLSYPSFIVDARQGEAEVQKTIDELEARYWQIRDSRRFVKEATAK